MVFNPAFVQITLLNTGLQITQGVIKQFPGRQHTLVIKGLLSWMIVEFFAVNLKTVRLCSFTKDFLYIWPRHIFF
jgi:hypothetical protein